MVKKPDNELRQQVWAETYFKRLKEGERVSYAMKTADNILGHFDTLFTQKTVL